MRGSDVQQTGTGRPSIPPERLVRASTLQVLYSIRSERLLCEQLDYNLLRRIVRKAGDAYDTADFVADCRKRGVTAHVAMNVTGNRDSAIDARTARHPGYIASQRIRKRIEECFGWADV
ncbi:MAG: hypothetical protein AMXMBFR37_26030 [Steroidobacteraceae bacterium]